MDYNKLLEKLKGQFADIEWQPPVDSTHGLLTTSAAFVRAKEEGKNPVEIASELNTDLNTYLNTEFPEFTSVTKGPYINIVATNVFYENLLQNMSGSDPDIEQDDRNVMFEYLGLNVAKRPHMGHLRNMIIGDSLRRLLQLKFPNLTTDHHWGDWGVQFGILLWAYKQELNQQAYEADPIEELSRLYVWGNAQKDSVEGWEQLVRGEFLALEAGDPDNRALWQEWVDLSKDFTAKEFEIWGIPDTDLHQGESFYEPVMNELTEYLDANDIWEKEGKARYFDLEKIAEQWKDLDPESAKRMKTYGRAYCISSNGYTTYVYRDIATRTQWARDHKTDLAITVTGNEQQHNFHQAFSIVSYLATRKDYAEIFGVDTAERITLDSLLHIPYGFLTLSTGKMSSREGNVILIPEIRERTKDAVLQSLESKDSRISADNDDAVHTLVMASLKWSEVSRDRTTDVVLDPEKTVQFEGNTGVYQLYSYARIAGVLKENADARDARPEAEKLTDAEKLILQMLYETSRVIETAIAHYKPNILAEHIYDLNQKMNSWYASTSVKNENDPARKATMLQVCDVFCSMQKKSLELLGIEVLEEM